MKLPLYFEAQSTSESGIQKTWLTESVGIESKLAIPPEFAGPGGGLSPEDLFAQALTNCFVATFKVYAENSKLQFDQLIVKSILKVDFNENKKPVMSECLLKVQIIKASQIEKAQLLAKKTFESGFILNSVKTKLNFEVDVS